MKEILKNFLETSNERIKNPLIASFILSWFIINWRPLSVLFFSEETVENRIVFIDANYLQISNIILLPLAIAIFYLIAIPYIMWLFEEILKKSTRGRKKNNKSQIIDDIRNKQEIAIEETKLQDIKANYREKADLNKKIEILNDTIQEKTSNINELQSKLRKTQESYESLKSSIAFNPELDANKIEEEYKEFTHSNIFHLFQEVGIELRNYNNFPSHLSEIDKEKFILQDIVQEYSNNESERMFYRFTDKGKYFWKKYILNLDNNSDLNRNALLL